MNFNMKVFTLTTYLIILFINSSFSQDTTIIYYDKDWKIISDKELASYYRKTVKNQASEYNVIDYYLNGKIQMTGSYKDKLQKIKAGHYVYYYENGIRQSEGDYLNNMKVDRWIYWHENGIKELEGDMKNGKKEGIWTEWYDNGQKLTVGKYTLDRQDGTWVSWFDTGETLSEGNLVNGYLDGIWKIFYKSGQTKYLKVFKEKFIVSETGYYVNNVIKYKGDYKKGEKHGEWKFYDFEGNLYFNGSFIFGAKNGEWTRYFKSKETMKLFFKNDDLLNKELGGITIKTFDE